MPGARCSVAGEMRLGCVRWVPRVRGIGKVPRLLALAWPPRRLRVPRLLQDVRFQFGSFVDGRFGLLHVRQRESRHTGVARRHGPLRAIAPLPAQAWSEARRDHHHLCRRRGVPRRRPLRLEQARRSEQAAAPGKLDADGRRRRRRLSERGLRTGRRRQKKSARHAIPPTSKHQADRKRAPRTVLDHGPAAAIAVLPSPPPKHQPADRERAPRIVLDHGPAAVIAVPLSPPPKHQPAEVNYYLVSS